MSEARPTSPMTIGVSLKMYFGHARMLSWASAVARIAREHEAVRCGNVELVVIPTFPSLVPVRDILDGTGVRLGAQDLSWADRGAFTGEVSGAELREIGCDLVEIGHAERIRLFQEDERVIAGKVHAAFRNGLQPLVCIGEETRGSVADAVETVTAQLGRYLGAAIADGLAGTIIAAYEPVWAIGAPAPAPEERIIGVLDGIASWLAAHQELAGSPVIYGGSAGPGLLTRGAGRIHGLFLGRFAHDPAALRAVLDEAHELSGQGVVP